MRKKRLILEGESPYYELTDEQKRKAKIAAGAAGAGAAAGGAGLAVKNYLANKKKIAAAKASGEKTKKELDALKAQAEEKKANMQRQYKEDTENEARKASFGTTKGEAFGKGLRKYLGDPTDPKAPPGVLPQGTERLAKDYDEARRKTWNTAGKYIGDTVKEGAGYWKKQFGKLYSKVKGED